MWVKQAVLAIIGLSGGMLVAGGLFAFIVSLGIVSDFADRTHTGDKVLLYEDAVALGGILGNIFYLYEIPLKIPLILVGVFGIFAGVFVGCWAMALAEVLNVFPIFVRRTKLLCCIPYVIISIAIGKGIGALVYLIKGW